MVAGVDADEGVFVGATDLVALGAEELGGLDHIHDAHVVAA